MSSTIETFKTRAEELDHYKAMEYDFTDFKLFEGEFAERKGQRADFMDGREYSPRYTYDQLEALFHNDEHRGLKSDIYKAVLELEAAKAEPGANVAELEIYADYHALTLHKMMLVEAARDVNNAATSGEWEVATRSYSELNKEVYGEYDTDTFSTMMNTELGTLQGFRPTQPEAATIKRELAEALSHLSFDPERQEKPLMDEESFRNLQEVVAERYSDILSVVPDTADDVYYDVDQCVAIANAALQVGGLSEKGWVAVEDPKKSNPATNATDRKIMFPSSMRRNASELRRIIIHEQEAHARRGENGRDSGFKPLSEGTADYADVEEGLGVILECAIAGTLDSPAFHRARDRYIVAGLALGADGSPRDARSVYEVMWRTIAIRGAEDGAVADATIASAKELAYAYVENAFRGTEFWMRGVIYSKLKVYYEGLAKNAEFLSGTKEEINGRLDRALIGKYNHTNTVEYNNVMDVLARN